MKAEAAKCVFCIPMWDCGRRNLARSGAQKNERQKKAGLLNPPISGGWREDNSVGCVEKLGVTWSFSGQRTTGFCEAAWSPQ